MWAHTDGLCLPVPEQYYSAFFLGRVYLLTLEKGHGIWLVERISLTGFAGKQAFLDDLLPSPAI